MIKKIVISLSLILAILIAPITMVGCKTVIKSATATPDELVGLYIFDTINLKYNGVNTQIIETLTQEELDKPAPEGWDRKSKDDLKYGKDWSYLVLLIQLVKEEVGVYLNKDGTITFNIEESATPKGEDDIDVYEYKDMLENRTWFSKDNIVYVTGEFSLDSKKNEASHVFDKSVSLCFEIVGKNLKTHITIKYGYDEETKEYATVEDYTFVLHRANY